MDITKGVFGKMKMIKRTVAAVAITGLLASSFPAQEAMAQQNAPHYAVGLEKLVQSELIKGSGQGVSEQYWNTGATKIQGALLYLRLAGLEQEALNYTGDITFDDASQAGKLLEPVVGYLKQHPYLGWIGSGDHRFEPQAPLTAEEYARILLKALRYEEGIDYEAGSAVDFAAKNGITSLKGAARLTNRQMAEATAQALQSKLNQSNVTLEEKWSLARNKAKYTPGILKQTKYGPIQGKLDAETGTYSWLGVPYAAKPVGELRWRAPQEPKPWASTLKTQEFANSSLQLSGGKTVGSEDSLYLNIWRPDTDSSNLPVMVFLHGGGNMTGSGKDFVGDQLARNTNSIIITVNYRLGALGFFKHEALATGDSLDDSGNYGLLDAIRALEWVRDNIEVFGGDPDNVTLSGQSAGGRDVLALLISPLSEGLFQRAIAFSGGMTTSAPEEGEAKSNEVLARLLVEDGKAASIKDAQAWIAKAEKEELAKYLREQPADRLVQLFGSTAIRMEPFPHLFRDGAVIPKEGFEAIKKGNYKKVPVMLGSLETEFSAFSFTDPYFASAISDGTIFTDSAKAEQYTAALKYGSELYAGFNAERVAEALTMHADQPPVYAYRFAWGVQPGVISDKLRQLIGAPHGADMDFYTGHAAGIAAYFPEGYFSEENKPGRDELSKAMAAYLKYFLYNGAPDNGGSDSLVTWTPWNSEAGKAKILRLDASKTRADINMSSEYYEGKTRVVERMKEEITEEAFEVLVNNILNGRFFWEFD